MQEYAKKNGITPHSLKVATISAIMGEIVKGKANLAQPAAQENYRAANAQDMRKVYPGNSAQQKIFVSEFAQKSFIENTNAEVSQATYRDFRKKFKGAALQ